MTKILRKCAILRHQLTFIKSFVNFLQRQSGCRVCVCVFQTYGWLVGACTDRRLSDSDELTKINSKLTHINSLCFRWFVVFFSHFSSSSFSFILFTQNARKRQYVEHIRTRNWMCCQHWKHQNATEKSIDMYDVYLRAYACVRVCVCAELLLLNLSHRAQPYVFCQMQCIPKNFAWYLKSSRHTSNRRREI